MATVTVTNQKGGVAKTHTSANLAIGLARSGKRVLAVDLDAQSPIATAFGVTVPDDQLSITDALRANRLSEIVCETRTPNLFLVPGDMTLDAETLGAKGILMKETILQRALAPINDAFDFILVDTPPSLDLVTINAIMAADWLILPCEPDRESLESLKRTLMTAFKCLEYRPEIDPENFYRVVATLYDDREKTITAWFEGQLAGLGKAVFQTRIHRATAFKKARAHGMTIFEYAERTREEGARSGAQDFEQLTVEVLAHESQRRNHDQYRDAGNAA